MPGPEVRPATDAAYRDIIDRFTRDHDAFVAQLDKLKAYVEAGGDVREAIVGMRVLGRPLLQHASNEEGCLFPELIEKIGGPDGPVRVLQEEHVVIHGQVDELTADPNREKFVAIYRAFDRLLREHIDKEREVVFPLSQELLGERRLQELDRQVPSQN